MLCRVLVLWGVIKGSGARVREDHMLKRKWETVDGTGAGAFGAWPDGK